MFLSRLETLCFADLASFFIDLSHEVAAGKHANHALPGVLVGSMRFDIQSTLQHFDTLGKGFQG